MMIYWHQLIQSLTIHIHITGTLDIAATTMHVL